MVSRARLRIGAGVGVGEGVKEDVRPVECTRDLVRQKVQQGDPIAKKVLNTCQSIMVPSRTIASHNDMHGLNMLLGKDAKIYFIDFGTALFMSESMVVAKLLMNFEQDFGLGASKHLVSALEREGFKMDAKAD